MSPKLNSLNLFIFSPVPGRCEPLCVHLHPSSWSSHSSLPWRKRNENLKTHRWRKVCLLEGDEDFLVSNRHPHCLTILNSSRHRHRHLRLLLEQMLAINLLRDSHNWTDHLLSMVGLTMTIALGARILIPSTFALTPPAKVTIVNAWSRLYHETVLNAWN